MKKASSDLLLLDVNVLIALAWPNHQFHRAATERMGLTTRWATCALTELGFVRISSNPGAIPGAKTPAQAAALLSLMVKDSRHVFLQSLPSPVAGHMAPGLEKILGHQQITDAYLLALAGRHGATLLTFDARLKHFAPSPSALEVLGES
jgi:toxin-antitoxin system PIN domain toxin